MPKRYYKTFSNYDQAYFAAGHQVASSQRARSAIWKDLDSGLYAVRYSRPKYPGRWVVVAIFKDGCYYHD